MCSLPAGGEGPQGCRQLSAYVSPAWPPSLSTSLHKILRKGSGWFCFTHLSQLFPSPHQAPPYGREDRELWLVLHPEPRRIGGGQLPKEVGVLLLEYGGKARWANNNNKKATRSIIISISQTTRLRPRECQWLFLFHTVSEWAELGARDPWVLLLEPHHFAVSHVS